MQNQNMRYFLYARKSTDEPDRQILSIEAQLTELREYALKERLLIAREFIESKTAKEPGREVFNEMIAALEQGAAQGIIAWHPDRLARNSVDGGRIIYLVDTGKITALKFPTFWFDPTPQGKFMLSIAFGQSKYYVDNLSENIKRGIRQKLRNGVWPGWAPLGYLNEKNLRTIVADPEKAPLVKKVFDLYATGNYPMAQIRNMVNDLGLIGKKNKTLTTSNYQHILKNHIYYGLLKYKGETYEGTHPPLISKKLFDRCQEVMLSKSKPKTPGLKPFVYRGMFRCGECGCCITMEFKKGRSYMHCSKRKGPCSQRFSRETDIELQLREEIKSVALCSAWASEILAHLEKEKSASAQAGGAVIKDLQAGLEPIAKKLDSLLDLALNGQLTHEEYAIKKAELIGKKKAIQEKLEVCRKKDYDRFTPVIDFFAEASHVGELAEAGNPEEIRDFVKKTGSHFRLRDKKIAVEYKNHWRILHNFLSRPAGKKEKNAETPNWWRCRESHPSP
jgi:DNA invertase Pin-like site-specific DNA recombinase